MDNQTDTSRLKAEVIALKKFTVEEKMRNTINFLRGVTAKGIVASLLAGTAMMLTVSLLADVKPAIGLLQSQIVPPVESAAKTIGDYEIDAFDTAAEQPLSQLINAMVLSPSAGVALLQRISLLPELSQLLDSPETEYLLIDQDIFALTEDPTFDQLIATAPVKDLWALQRELEALTDPQLKQASAAQLVDAFHRFKDSKSHPEIAKMLADEEFLHYLQTAELTSLRKDARARELASLIISSR